MLGEGLGGQEFCDDNTKALVIKSVTMGGGVKIVENCMTSFMYDPLFHPLMKGTKRGRQLQFVSAEYDSSSLLNVVNKIRLFQR